MKLGTNVLFDISVTNELKVTDQALCDELTKRLKDVNPLYNLVLTVDRDYFSVRFGEEEE